MDVLYTNCAGLDVHKKTVKVCLFKHVPNGQPDKELRTYLTTTEELLKLGDWLKEQECTHVAMEATGVISPVIANMTLDGEDQEAARSLPVRDLTRRPTLLP